MKYERIKDARDQARKFVPRGRPGAFQKPGSLSGRKSGRHPHRRKR